MPPGSCGPGGGTGTWGAPVVVISAYPELVEAVVDETVGVLHKPIDLEILVECVQYHCGLAVGSGGAPRGSGCLTAAGRAATPGTCAPWSCPSA